MDLMYIVTLLSAMSTVHCAIPGAFFWRPKMALDMSIPTTETLKLAKAPTWQNINKGFVVLIDGYQVGMTVLALTVGLTNLYPYLHLNPLHSYYYTNVYRWMLRYLSLVPGWLAGSGSTYNTTHKVWRRRFNYMDRFVPEYLRKLFPWVSDKEWKQEEEEFRRFSTYAEPAFGKHMRLPNRNFNNFKSAEQIETIENLDNSDLSSPVWAKNPPNDF